jgi:hypothetical protein
VHGPLVGDEAGHAHLVASLTHRTTDRFKTSRSIRSRAFSARNRFSSATPRRKPLHAFVFSAVLSNPVTLGARVDAQVARYRGDRLTRLTDDADRTLPELRVELPSRIWHDYSSKSMPPQFWGMSIAITRNQTSTIRRRNTLPRAPPAGLEPADYIDVAGSITVARGNDKGDKLLRSDWRRR